MKYQANPVEVDAFKIAKVVGTTVDGSLQLILDNGQHVSALPGMTARMTPVVGDYYVIQSDGYIYLNPKHVFERKYGALEPIARELGAATRRAGIA